MRLKKLMFLGASLTLLSLPLTAVADLDTYNYTDEDSSVRVTSGSARPCSSDASVYTPKRLPDGSPGHSNVKEGQIKGLCLTSKNNTCTADIYNSNNCTRDKVGQASLNMTTKKVISATSTNPRYSIEMQSGGTVLILRYTA